MVPQLDNSSCNASSNNTGFSLERWHVFAISGGSAAIGVTIVLLMVTLIVICKRAHKRRSNYRQQTTLPVTKKGMLATQSLYRSWHSIDWMGALGVISDNCDIVLYYVCVNSEETHLGVRVYFGSRILISTSSLVFFLCVSSCAYLNNFSVVTTARRRSTKTSQNG